MKKVVAAGHICMDITPSFLKEAPAALWNILSPGKLTQVGAADIHTGGSAANTGLAMKFFGAQVTLVGKTGEDELGELMKNILRSYQAEEGLITVKGESTSYSVILAVPGVDRIILHHPGSNDSFCMEDIPNCVFEECALFHFGYPTLMKKMYQGEGQELLKILRKAQEAGAATSLDFAMINQGSEAGRADWAEILRRVLPYVDFFVPSVEELCFMLDKERFARWQERAAGRDVTEILELEKDIKPLAGRCLELGAKVLLLKCGAMGMYVRTKERKELEGISPRIGLDLEEWSSRELFERSYAPEQVLSGNGAGDTSIAAFLTAMLEGCKVEEALRLAAATGASCVEAYDALSGLRTFQELREKISKGWKKYE